MTIYLLGALTIFLPLMFITWFSLGTAQSKFEWLLRFLLVGSIVLIFYRIGLWSVTSYYLRFVIVAIFVGSTLYSFRKIHAGTGYIPKKRWFRFGSTVLFAILGVLASALTLSGAHYSGNAVNLKFPLAQGKYCVLQGGSNLMTNPFHGVVSAGKYAIDLVEIDYLGNRATSIFPTKLTQYHIFGDTIRSPCNGRVLSTASGLPDNLPTAVDRENTAGNHVVIECDSIQIMFAHLKEGSLRVGEGNEVKEGQPVGEVGNSGYTDEPHLHIQANTVEGHPVPITFGERFVSINDLYIVK